MPDRELTEKLTCHVTRDAKRHLARMKVDLRYKGVRTTEQAIVDALILTADVQAVEEALVKCLEESQTA